MTNKLWLVYRTDSVGYDEYDSFVIYAENAEYARNRMPNWDDSSEEIDWNSDSYSRFSSWTNRKENVEVSFLGIADLSCAPGSIVISSFNAG